MAKYRLNMALDGSLEFESAGPDGVFDAWRAVYRSPPAEHDRWRRRCASMVCDRYGQPVRFDSDEAFIADLFRHGALEEVHA